MIELEPEVPRRVRLLFMIGGGVGLFLLVMLILVMRRTHDPSYSHDDPADPPIQQQLNIDPLRPTPLKATDLPEPSPDPATRPATRPTTAPATSEAGLP